MPARLSALLVVTVLTGTTPQSGDVQPPVPFEDIGACPFEGCVYRQWTARQTVAIRSDRRADARIVFRVKAGEKVTALTGVVVTVRAGRVQFRQPQDLSSSSGPIHVVPGQTLYLLTDQGEGYTKAWFNGRLYKDVDASDFSNGVCDAAPSRCNGKVIEPSRTEWWVQVRNAVGQIGWTREPDKFDGKDALS